MGCASRVLGCRARARRQILEMNVMRRRDPQLREAEAEHRRREDEAARLHEQGFQLSSLRFRFEDVRPEGRQVALPYSKLVVVSSAPALFEIRCMEPRCDGRHDLTYTVLGALRQAKTSFTGEHPCAGMVGDLPCDRTLVYEVEATFARMS